jgi:hypothetical protein
MEYRAILVRITDLLSIPEILPEIKAKLVSGREVENQAEYMKVVPLINEMGCGFLCISSSDIMNSLGS